MKKNRLKRRLRYHSTWNEPQTKDCVIHIGSDLEGRIVGSQLTDKQIKYVRSKTSLLHRNDRHIDIDEIIIESRKPVSLDRHKSEYGSVMIPRLMSVHQPFNLHPEEIKNDYQDMYLKEVYRIPLLEYIRLDRIMRGDNKTPMADRPPLVVITISDDAITRLEFYRGHNELVKQLDLRSPSSQETELSDSFTETMKYDVAQNEFWTASMMGIRLEEFIDMVELAHESLLCDYCKISFNGKDIPL